MVAEIETEIGFAQLGLGSILKQYMLQVPLNQREYAWGQKEVRTLFQDFSREIKGNTRSYFLGTVVTIPRPGGHLEVVDGQQRLATTAILLSAIRDHLREPEPEVANSIDNDFLSSFDRNSRQRVPKLRLNIDDNEYFRNRIEHPEHPPEAVRPSHTLLDEAFTEASHQVRTIVSGLDPLDHGDELIRWIDFLEARASIILLRVPNADNAYRMFETLNDRGKRVSQSDLVKNYLFGEAGDRFDEVQQRWSYMRGALESMEEEDITITFLRHALTIIRGFVREADVYDAVESHVSGPQPGVAFTGQLETLANAFVAIGNPDHERWNQHGSGTRHALDVLNLFNISPLRPLLLAIAQTFDGKQAEDAFTFCVALSVRLMIGNRTRTGTVEQGLAEAAHKIFTGEIATCEELRTQISNITPTDGQFSAAFANATVTNRKLARYYLRSLEMAAMNESQPWHVPNDDSHAINLEHVLPIKPGESWPKFSDDDVKLFRNRIGNMALLQATANSGLQSADFATKVEVYAKSPYKTTRTIADEDEWTSAQIVKRQEYLRGLALKAWKLDE